MGQRDPQRQPRQRAGVRRQGRWLRQLRPQPRQKPAFRRRNLRAVFAAGVPAKIIRKKETAKLSVDGKNAIVLEMLSDFQRYALNYLKLKNTTLKAPHSFVINFENGRLVYTLDFKNIQTGDVIVSFLIPTNIKKKYDWIELDTLSSSTNKDIAKYFIAFIKRYGIKIK